MSDLDWTKVRQVQSNGANIDSENGPRRSDIRADRLPRNIIRVYSLKIIPYAVDSDISTPGDTLMQVLKVEFLDTTSCHVQCQYRTRAIVHPV